ncbi:MAG TPA: 30S ribosomal protein S8e [Candidatus Thermoplasmatota archaeon]|nr:30S ribosomal protein S8e [Candidatus Thermoplasmatota archaeon]
MAIWQGKSQRKPTGGRLHLAAKKRKSEIGAEPHLTSIGEHKRKTVRTRGGHKRTRVLVAKTINVTDPKSGKTTKADILTVTGNPANPNYIRRNIVTKGAVVKTSAGNARVTSRPGQDGTVNGVLVE